jgi:DNA-binding NarL/FixJ family response regulator
MADTAATIAPVRVTAPINGHHPPNGRSDIAETLTGREMQVLRLMADGLSTKQIGITLNITFKTAASHRSRILSKMGVHETVSAVRMAIRSGVVEP